MNESLAWHYQGWGEPTKPAILFLHGFMGSAADWRTVGEKLGNNFYCLAADLPYHGETRETGHGPYTMDSTARAFINLIDELGIRSASLIGYSMGGRLALFLALEYPQRFSHLVLESASPGLETERERAARRAADEALAARLEREPLEAFLHEWYHRAIFAGLTDHPEFPVLWRRRLENDPVRLARALRDLGTGAHPSLWGRLKELAMPTLLLVGERDEKFVGLAEKMRMLIPNASSRIFKNCGHVVHFEKSDEFCREVSQFVRSSNE